MSIPGDIRLENLVLLIILFLLKRFCELVPEAINIHIILDPYKKPVHVYELFCCTDDQLGRTGRGQAQSSAVSIRWSVQTTTLLL